MYKVILKYNNSITKSYDIYDIWKLIVSNPLKDFNIYISYDRIKPEDFLKTFLYKSHSYRDYIRLRESFFITPTIKQYGKARRIIP